MPDRTLPGTAGPATAATPPDRPSAAAGAPRRSTAGRTTTDRRGCVDQRRERPQRPPHARPRPRPDPLVEPRLELGLHPRPRRLLEQVRDDRLGLRERQARPREPAIAQPRAAQRRLHRLVERRVVLRDDRVQGDPHERRLDDRLLRERAVEVAGVEALHPVPEGEVRGGRLLCLQRHDPAHCLDHVHRPAAQEQLAGQRRPVQPARRERHAGETEILADRRAYAPTAVIHSTIG